MLTLFCPHCSQSNFYNLHRPSICGFCGQSLTSLGASPPKTAPKSNFIPKSRPNVNLSAAQVTKKDDIEEIEDDDDFASVDELPEISELQIEPLGSKTKGIKMEELMKQPKSSFSEESGPKPKKMSKKQIIEQYKAEASNIKRDYNEGGGEE